jgi:hypothetical protein
MNMEREYLLTQALMITVGRLMHLVQGEEHVQGIDWPKALW